MFAAEGGDESQHQLLLVGELHGVQNGVDSDTMQAQSSGMTTLTQEEKRILIAEACGWKMFTTCDVGLGSTLIADIWPGQEVMGPREVPDYFNDLNACHEMEQVGFEGQLHRPWDSKWDRFKYEELLKTRGPNVPVFAPAFQRAECFGLLMGLWT